MAVIGLLAAFGVIAGPAQADPAAAIADPATRQAAMACESALANAAGGELQSISVKSVERTADGTVLEGRLRVFVKPKSPPPGMLAPTHVINAEMGFQCRLSAPKVARATVQPISN